MVPTLLNKKDRFAFIIPVYNHATTVAQVVRDAQTLGFPVFVVDDGSTDNRRIRERARPL